MRLENDADMQRTPNEDAVPGMSATPPTRTSGESGCSTRIDGAQKRQADKNFSQTNKSRKTALDELHIEVLHLEKEKLQLEKRKLRLECLKLKQEIAHLRKASKSSDDGGRQGLLTPL